MIFLAQYLHIVIIAGTLLFAFLQKRPVQIRMFLLASLSLPLTLLAARVAGYIFNDPRPFAALHFTPLIPHAADNGFPSDHALLGFALGMLVFRFNRTWGTVLCLLAMVLGLSRIYVGVHSPLDILGSFLVSGGVMLFLGILTHSRSRWA